MQIKTFNKLKAFTLFELLIVTFIISLVYVMFVVNFTTREKETISLQTFKEYIAKQKYKKYIKLTCLESEKFCRVYIDDNDKYEALKLFENHQEMIVYDFDRDDELQEIEFGEFKVEYEDIPIALNMYFYASNKHKPYLIDDGGRVIYFSIFKNITFFQDLSEAKDFFIDNKENLIKGYKEKLL